MERVFDFRSFEDRYDGWEDSFRIGEGPGNFSFLRGGRPCVYGSTDMVFSRAAMGHLELEPSERRLWAERINSFQVPRSGWYRKSYTAHFREHTAAYAVAALKLLGETPRYPVRACARVSASRAAMERWLATVPWSIIWPASHIVSGLPAILHMTGTGRPEFFDELFDWLDARVEPTTGYWSRGLAQRIGLLPKRSKEEMGGAFHFYYLYEARGRSWPRLEEVVDATLALQKPSGLWDGEFPYCIDLDGVYSILRSSENASRYRADEVHASCVRFLIAAEGILNSQEDLFGFYSNSHRLPGALSAIAECERAFPGIIRTQRPWVQTLDAACFI